MDIEAKGLDHKALNEAIRAAGPVCRIRGCMGQRFIGAGMSGRSVEIDGVPGNALGAYLGNINIGIMAESFPNTLRSFILPHFSQGRNGKLRVQLR